MMRQGQEPPQDVVIVHTLIPYSEELEDVYWMLGPAALFLPDDDEELEDEA